MSTPPRPVFYDPGGIRARASNAIGLLAALVISAGLMVLVFGILVPPLLPKMSPPIVETRGSFSASGWAAKQSAEPGFAPMHNRNAPASFEPVKRYAFFARAAGSFESLQRHADAIDALIPYWLGLGGGSKDITQWHPTEEAAVRIWIRQHARHLEVYPALTSKLTVAETAARIAVPSKRSSLARAVAAYLRRNDYQGLTVSLPDLPATSHTHLVMFLRELGGQIRPEGRKIILVVPPNKEGYRYQELARAADYLLISTHESAVHQSSPGPIASQGWFERQITAQFAHVDRNRLIVSIGSFGREWRGAKEARHISVQAAWNLLEEERAELKFDPQTLNPNFNFIDSRGLRHDVWFLDGVTGFNQAKAALALQPAGLAVWRLGLEDPSIWASVGRGRWPDQTALKNLKLPSSGFGTYSGVDDAIVSSVSAQKSGQRALSYNKNVGLIVQQSMERIPQETQLTSWPVKDKRLLALTFDDGPDGRFTGKILDILAEKSVNATFFVMGINAIRFPTLLKRIYDEGHDIGNHTFRHPDLAELTNQEIKFELNATQRILESHLGIHSILFRPPYVSQTFFTEMNSGRIVETASRLGYVTVGVSVDPYDWMPDNGARKIKLRIERQVLGGLGQIVLLHDAGGTGNQTTGALPSMIDRMRARGFRFVTLHELIAKSRQDVMPTVDTRSLAAKVAANTRWAIVQSLGWLAENLPLFCLAATFLGILRVTFIIAAALVQKSRERRRSALEWQPKSVAVLVPAYNEEKVICKTVQSILASSGQQGFDILVIDDGSSDRTADVVRMTFAQNDRVKVIEKSNGGKAAALNFGISQTEAEVIIAIDADTVLAHDAIKLLMRHFSDPSVGAVAGSVTIGNRINLITRFQALEYITSQNFDRRGFELFNAIAVVPGAIGAWRRQAVVEAGGYSSDTLAEDADLTVAIERQNWKVLYEPRAYARTEAPETVRAFMKQRFRWMFGTLQMAYKHSGAMVSGKPGGVAFITIPNILLFQFAFTLFAPIIDVLLVWLVVTTLAWDMTPTDQATIWIVAQFWLLFQVLDVAAATLAMKLDEGWKNWSLLPLLLLQRFCYRQLLYFVAARTVLAAIKGRFVGWGKLIRTGRVSQQGSPVPRHSIPLFRSKLVGLRRPMRGARLNERGA